MFHRWRSIRRAGLFLLLLNEIRGLIFVAAAAYGFSQYAERQGQSMFRLAAVEASQIVANIWTG